MWLYDDVLLALIVGVLVGGVTSLVASVRARRAQLRDEEERRQAEEDDPRRALREWQRTFDVAHPAPAPSPDREAAQRAYQQRVALMQATAAQQAFANQAALAQNAAWASFQQQRLLANALQPLQPLQPIAPQDHHDEALARLCRQRGGLPS